MKYLFDTNIFLYYVFNNPIVKDLFSTGFIEENDIITTSIVRIELLSYHNLSESEEISIKRLLELFNILSLDLDIENEAIRIRKLYKLKLPDAIIAATAIVEDATLVTYDKKDFQKVKELKIY